MLLELYEVIHTVIMSSQRKRKRAEVDCWRPLHDVPMLIENNTNISASITVFTRNEASSRLEDVHLVWKNFNISSPGSANLVYTKRSAVGAVCTVIEGGAQPKRTTAVVTRSQAATNGKPTTPTAKRSASASTATVPNGVGSGGNGSANDRKTQVVGPKECKDGSTWMFIPPNTHRLKCELEHDEDAIPTPKGSVLMVNKYSLRDYEVVFGLYKLGSMLLGQRDVARGHLTYFAQSSILYFAISKEPKVKAGEFIQDLSIFDDYWSADLKIFPNGINVAFTMDGDSGKFSFTAQQKY